MIRHEATLLAQTPLLDYDHPRIAALIAEQRWPELDEPTRIAAIYRFVRDDIAFGYNRSDDIPASEVLADGYGQCNTKTILLMALLRATGTACRLHGGAIHKRLQHGVVRGLWYALAPREITHTWAEVCVNGRWTSLEGVILDARYLDGVRAEIGQPTGPFVGFAIGTDDIASPSNEWRGEDTSIQRRGLIRDDGVFDEPDRYYARFGGNFSGVRALLFERFARPAMNKRVRALRSQRTPRAS